MISSLKSYLVTKGAPVIIGEWGTSINNGYALYRQNMLSFARYFVEQTKANNIGTFYWMGLSDGASRSVPEFNQMDLKDAIIKGYYGEEGYTGINPTTFQMPDDGNIYNLSGSRIMKPQKGIFIQNGKKHIAK